MATKVHTQVQKAVVCVLVHVDFGGGAIHVHGEFNFETLGIVRMVKGSGILQSLRKNKILQTRFTLSR